MSLLPADSGQRCDCRARFDAEARNKPQFVQPVRFRFHRLTGVVGASENGGGRCRGVEGASG